MNSAILYARVSSKEQEKEGYSIPAQLRLLNDYAHKNNLRVVQEFIDVETAKQAGRTNFGEMIKFLQASPDVKIILVEKTDRLYRNFKDYVTIDDLELEIHLVKEGEILSKNSKSHQKFIHGIKVLMAKNYIDNLSEETKKGQREKAEQGVYPTKPPLGYQNNPDTRKIDIDPEKALIVKKMFEWYSSGNYSIDAVKSRATQAGLTYRSGKKVSKSTVEHILKDPFYYGDFFWAGQLYHGSHTPLVSRELWDRAQEALIRKNKGKLTQRNFAFSGMMTCAFCGCALTSEIKKGRYVYYHCTGKRGKCAKPYVRQEVIEEKYGQVIRNITISDDVLNWLVQALGESHQEEKDFHNRMISQLQAEYRRLQDRMDRAYEDKLDGKIPEDFFLNKLQEWKDKQSEISSKLRTCQEANTNYLVEGSKLLELANKAYSLYLRQEPHEKAKLVKFVSSNSTWDGENLIPTYRKPFDLIAVTNAEHKQKELAGATKSELRPIWLLGQGSNLQLSG